MESAIKAPTTKRPRQKLSNDDLKHLLDRVKVAESVDTDAAAAYLDFAPQTLRRWACYEHEAPRIMVDGISRPLKPRRINRQLRWMVSELNALLTVAS